MPQSPFFQKYEMARILGYEIWFETRNRVSAVRVYSYRVYTVTSFGLKLVIVFPQYEFIRSAYTRLRVLV